MMFLLAAASFAADLDTLIEDWAVSVTGPDGAGLTGVAIDATDAVVAVGWLGTGDGALDDDGWIGVYDVAGLNTATWTYDGAGIDGHDDAFLDVAVHPTADDIIVAGYAYGDGTSDWLVRSYDPAGIFQWEHRYTDGLQSPEQAAMGVDTTDLEVYATGTSYRNAVAVGRWLGFRYDEVTGAVNLVPTITYDHLGLPFAQDVANDIAALHDGTFALVGARGASDTDAGVTADTDWHVRTFDALGTLVWEDTFAGGAGLLDAATAAVFDDLGNLYVAGWESTGTDNTANADSAWVVTKYAPGGSGGLADILWTSTLEGGVGPDQATSIALDNEGHLMVGGFTTDDAGLTRWTVGQFHYVDGYLISQRDWPSTGGDGTVTGVAYRNLTLMVSGTDSDGTAVSGRLVRIEEDSDGDGLGDSNDPCPEDGTKTDPGVCGCGVPDVDTDYDTVLDCEDDCPTNGEKTEPGECGCLLSDVDTDSDGTKDCNDQCSTDPTKVLPGICGCGVPDEDSDNDGVPGCDDACLGTPEGEPVDDAGCPEGQGAVPLDTGDTDVEPPPDDSGCNCQHTPSVTPWWALIGLGWAMRRRGRG